MSSVTVSPGREGRRGRTAPLLLLAVGATIVVAVGFVVGIAIGSSGDTAASARTADQNRAKAPAVTRVQSAGKPPNLRGATTSSASAAAPAQGAAPSSGSVATPSTPNGGSGGSGSNSNTRTFTQEVGGEQ